MRDREGAVSAAEFDNFTAQMKGIQDPGRVEVRLPLLERGHAAVPTLGQLRFSVFRCLKKVPLGTALLLLYSVDHYLPGIDENSDPARKVDHRTQWQTCPAGNHADGVSYPEPEERDRAGNRYPG